jgi:hypothetical protein
MEVCSFVPISEILDHDEDHGGLAQSVMSTALHTVPSLCLSSPIIALIMVHSEIFIKSFCTRLVLTVYVAKYGLPSYNIRGAWCLFPV